MTGMSAKDRIPLLERELLRIQNELAAARAEDHCRLCLRDGRIAGIRDCAAFLRKRALAEVAKELEQSFLGD